MLEKVHQKTIIVPDNIHSILLPIICRDVPIDSQLHKRVINIFLCLAKSNNVYNNLTLQLLTDGSKSRLSNSINYICYKYGICKYHLYNIRLDCIIDSMIHSFCANVDVRFQLCAHVTIDMLMFLYQKKFDILNQNQICQMLTFACT